LNERIGIKAGGENLHQLAQSKSGSEKKKVGKLDEGGPMPLPPHYLKEMNN